MIGTLIVGGGATGLSLAYHLGGLGAERVVLLERNRLGSGTTWHAAGIVGPLRATSGLTKLVARALELFPALEEETGLGTGYRRTGGYWLAREAARMDELRRIAALGRSFGLDAEVVRPGDVRFPGLNPDGLAGALRVAEDASVNPVDLCAAYAKAAKSRGVEIREDSRVQAILVENGAAKGVRMEDGRELLAARTALCAGSWTKCLAEDAGVALPLQAVEHMYVVTDGIAELPDPVPIIRDMDRGAYVKGDAGRLLIGGFEADAKCWDPYGPEGDRPFLEMEEDWDQFGPFLAAALDLLPFLETVGIKRFMNGPESFTNDSLPLVGPAPEVEGLYVAAGMNSVGVMSSAGIGHALAHWMADGMPPFDLWEIDIARADPLAAAGAHMKERMKEAVHDVFALHWPYKQAAAGRGLRKSALHGHWRKAGAEFGVTAGWERGLWYARDESERGLPYSVGDQPWHPIAQREAAVMESGTALLDLSPFGKFDVSGPGALGLLQHLASSDLDVDPGRVVYTQLLNSNGGIEADVTVIRLSADRFRITSGAASRRRDWAMLRRSAAGRDVEIKDATEREAVIGVMGAGARETMRSVSDDDWSRFDPMTAREAVVAGVRISAARVSYVGELGWELSIPADSAAAVFEALLKSGARPMGHYAVDGCRIEKGFKHWGHDIGPETTPIEAGLGFAVCWEKDFLGKEALMRQKDEGPARRLALFEVAGGALLLHDEPIRESGRLVGFTSSGGRGPRTGKALAFGMVDIEPGETRRMTCEREFVVEVAGKVHRAEALPRPPFDPGGERFKA